MNRKEFLHAVTRISLLSLILMFVGWLVARNKLSITMDCAVNTYCRSCDRLSGCGLPAAEQERMKKRG